MNRAEFMKRLSELLYDVSPSEREEAIQYYNDYFDDAGAENERSVIVSLGTPEQVARTIKAGLFDGGNAGEFTEKGFSSQTQVNENEIIDLQKAYNKENTYSRQNNYGQQNNYSQQNNYNRQNNYEQQNNYNRQNSYGRQNTYSQQNGYGQQDNYSQQNNYGQQNTGSNQQNSKKPMSGGTIALVVVLCVLASPFLLGLFGSVIGILIGFFGAIFGIVVGLGAASLALLIVGIFMFAYGIILIFTIPLGGLCMMGGALICAAVGIVLLWLVGLICAGLIPASIRALVSLTQRLFHNRGGAKA